MSISNLVPFALRISDNQYVEVSDVPRGKDCGCICPSCDMPLIARKGDINSWHFAHYSLKYKRVEEECSYSKWVSIVAMAKQFIENIDYINTPKYEKMNLKTGELKNITEEKNHIALNLVKIKKLFEYNISVDAALEIKSSKGKMYTIGIIFSYPKMKKEIFYSSLKDTNNLGLLEICLDEFDYWFPEGTKSYKQLKDKIQNDNDIKKWLYHPNEITKEFDGFDITSNPSDYIVFINK